MQPFDKAIALSAPDLGGAIFDAFKLKKRFVRMTIRPSAVLRTVITGNRINAEIMFLEIRQEILDLVFNVILD